MIKNTNNTIEELTVLLASLHINNIKKYISKNKYILNYDIYDLSYIISKTFNENKNYYLTEEILTHNKYAIIDEKR